MVQWTAAERATIKEIFDKVDHDAVGHEALARCLIVYPWTQRYFGKFGNLYNADAIMDNPMVAKHGAVVMKSIENAAKNLDTIKELYKDLSVQHSETLHVDPDNFNLLADCLAIVVASKLGKDFTGDVHAVLSKLLSVVVASLSKGYH